MRQSALARVVTVASALLITSPCAAEVNIVVPVNYSGLEPGTTFIGFGCEVWDADNRLVGNGGLPFIPISRGVLDTTITIPVRRTEASAGVAARYTCHATVYGRRADGIAYNFMSANGRGSTRWSGESWDWPGDALGVTRGVLMLPRAGTRSSLSIVGTIPPGIAAGMAVVDLSRAGVCPCGCGEGGADGVACRMRTFAGYRLPAARTPSRAATPEPRRPVERKSPATITPESQRLGLETRPRVPIAGTGNVTPFVAAAPVVFVGDGRLTFP